MIKPLLQNDCAAGAGRSLRWRPLALAAALVVAGTASAQAPQSMEERLRAQLRVTTSQLQQAQNELASLKAGMPAPGKPGAGMPGASSAELEALKQDLARSQSRLAAERSAREKLDENGQQLRQQAQEVMEKSNAQVAQFRNAYDELLKMARASEAERQRLAGDSGVQRTALQQCEAKNAQIYSVGQEILRAYETLDVGSVLSARQPFATQARIKLDQVAQQYGDKLYEGRFDERSVTVAPAAAPAP